MSISLNHFSIRTLDLAATSRFYCEVIGLVDGPRPPFPFPGAWLYSGDTASYANALVHVIALDAKNPNGLNQYLGERDNTGLHGSGAVDHVAFFMTGLGAMLKKLTTMGIEARAREVPLLGLYQVFLDDPNGVVVELNYPAQENPALTDKSSANS
jgi:catechol 2,3-dioxygenase-like lactoylglutathione lyase family enzyme